MGPVCSREEEWQVLTSSEECLRAEGHATGQDLQELWSEFPLVHCVMCLPARSCACVRSHACACTGVSSFHKGLFEAVD